MAGSVEESKEGTGSLEGPPGGVERVRRGLGAWKDCLVVREGVRKGQEFGEIGW